MREECSDKGNMSYGGALWELLTMVERVRNVTFSIIRHPNPTWGLCYDKNNCTGMIGMVNRGEVDFALGKLKKKLRKVKLFHFDANDFLTKG